MSVGWGTQRKILYISVSVIVISVALTASYLFFFNTAPTCFDGRQDGTETGVDCGGSCARICANQAHDPIVLWSRAFPVASSTDGGTLYTAAAYVENTNVGGGAKSVQYSFQFFDANNSLILEHSGVTDLPPVQTIPIVETGIDTGKRTVARTLFSFSQTPTWNIVPAQDLPALSLADETLAPDGTRLSATVTNNSLIPVTNLTAVAVLFDAHDVAIAASKSLITSLPSHASQTVVFTWPQSAPSVTHAEITLLPSF